MADKRGGDGGGDGKRKKAKYMARLLRRQRVCAALRCR
jgi:hypothetical protein